MYPNIKNTHKAIVIKTLLIFSFMLPTLKRNSNSVYVILRYVNTYYSNIYYTTHYIVDIRHILFICQ